jgi:branched-chain amino acid transport system substrate-binding protein
MVTIRRRDVLGGGAAALALGVVRARAAEEPIRMALTAPLSGMGQSIGEPLRIGAEIAADQINRAGGVNGRKIEIVIFDDKMNPTETVASIKEMADRKINLIIGPPLTPNALAAQPLLEANGMVLCVAGAADERVTHENFMRNCFTANTNNYTSCRSYGRLLVDRYPNVTTWAAVYADISSQHAIWNVFSTMLKRAYEEKGRPITILDPQLTKQGAGDYKLQLSALQASPAEGFFNTLIGGDGITFFQQARQFGIDKKIKVFADYTLNLDLPQALKQNLPANVWTKSSYGMTSATDNPQLQEMHKLYAARTGLPVTHQLCLVAHSIVYFYAEAIRATGGTEAAKLIPALETIKLDTVRGPAYFRKEDHQIVCQLTFVRWAAKDAAPGWEAAESVSIPDAPNLNPPTPGVALKL